MNMKSILLGTAAGMMVATGAYAADLPGEAAPAAVDYVKVCDAYGAGFFYIPGTDTCLAIHGRIRAGIEYKHTKVDGVKTSDLHYVNAARVQFDTRSATELGTLRSFMEFSMEGSDRTVKVNNAFIQLGYFTFGRQDDVTDGDVLYGMSGYTGINEIGGNAAGDTSYNGVTVMVDDLGGGFFVGAGIYGDGSVADAPLYSKSGSTKAYDVLYSGIIGVTGQAWGSADLSGGYEAISGQKDDYFVKGVANLKIAPEFTARLTAAYNNEDDYDWETVSAALAYQATPDLSVYAGGAYIFNSDSVDDDYVLQLGASYNLVPGLILQGEVNYEDKDNAFETMVRLEKNW